MLPSVKAPVSDQASRFHLFSLWGGAIVTSMSVSSPHAAIRRLFDEVGTVDAVGIEERVAKYTTRSIKKASKVWGLKKAVSMVDLTTLEGKDTPGKVVSLCRKAVQPHDADLEQLGPPLPRDEQAVSGSADVIAA